MGHNLVAQTLLNAVKKRKVGLLYVFYAHHVTGKTSCAHIFARALNCQSLEHPKPCGSCNSCIAHDMGKSRNIREVGPVSNFDFESNMDLFDNMIVSQLPSHHRAFIFDDSDTLSSDCWSAISKVIDRVPRRVVFVLVSSSLDVLPHIIISRCQKFFFPKLKDADIIYTLQWTVPKEDLEIDGEALKLIASRSDGLLRDAEMTLEQLSLLGLRISFPLVQELVSLSSLLLSELEFYIFHILLCLLYAYHLENICFNLEPNNVNMLEILQLDMHGDIPAKYQFWNCFLCQLSFRRVNYQSFTDKVSLS